VSDLGKAVVLMVLMLAPVTLLDDCLRRQESRPAAVDEQFRAECEVVTAHVDKVTADESYEFVSVSDPGECDATPYTMQDIIDNCDLELEESTTSTSAS
jgi:hypothetical protein